MKEIADVKMAWAEFDKVLKKFNPSQLHDLAPAVRTAIRTLPDAQDCDTARIEWLESQGKHWGYAVGTYPMLRSGSRIGEPVTIRECIDAARSAERKPDEAK